MNTNFKRKKKKGPISDTRRTLAAIHLEREEEFDTLKNELPNKKKLLTKLEKRYKKYIINPNTESQQVWDLENQIESLKQNIKDIESYENEVEYYLNTADILHTYAEQTHNAPSTSQDLIVSKTKKKKKKKKKDLKIKRITDFFTVGNEIVLNTESESESEESEESDDDEMSGSVVKVTDFIITDPDSIKKSQILDKYMSKVDKDYLGQSYKIEQFDECVICGSDELEMENGCQICICCGYSIEDNMSEGYIPTYKEMQDMDVIPYFAYKRINHFNEWLSQFQAKENTVIPDNVIELINGEIKKLRIRNMIELTPKKLRTLLKKLGLNKYYEHVPHIINRLNGIPPLTMTADTEERLRMMFKQIQVPFQSHCPPKRKNFLSYSYVLHKFCQLLELDEFVPCFPLLKSRKKLYQQDQIWKGITRDLLWQYIPSV